MHRKVTWNAEDLFWIYDPIHTLPLADEFGFVGKKQLEQTTVRKRRTKVCMTVQTSWTNEKHNNTGL